MRFSGFGEDVVEFYDGLAADNSKAYWTDRREVYETHVRVPMQALLDDVEAEFGAEAGAPVGELGVRGDAVDVDLAAAEAAQVRAVEHVHLHACTSR